MNKQTQIAMTIRQQLYAGGVPVVWSWGTHEWLALPKTKNFDGGLQFRVQGRLYEGLVQVLLAYDDTYTLKFPKTPDVQFTGVYFDMLTDLINGIVETKS